MVGRYTLGYLFLCWFALLGADHERIDLYFSHFYKMQFFFNVLQQELGAKSSAACLGESYDNAIIGATATSDFICNCIHLSTLPKHAGAMATENAVIGWALAVYSLFTGFAQIWKNKYEFRTAVQQMQYSQMIVQYPHLVLIEYQIKLMQLLIDMCCNGSLPEQVFAYIHLVAMILPGPYARYTKKQAKFLYKNYFDKQGCLKSVAQLDEKKPYHNFYDKVCTDWHELVLHGDKYCTTFTLLYKSAYAQLVHNDYNQILLSIIDAGMHHDRGRIEQLRGAYSDPLILKLYSFYSSRIGA